MIPLDETTLPLVERFVAAMEAIAAKPPTVIAQPRAPQEQLIREEPRTADGIRYRHPLKSGGYLIEILVGQDQVAFLHEDKDGNRRRFVFG